MAEQYVHVLVRHANALEDVERFGKNDPLTKVALDLKADKENFPQTTVKKNAGKTPEWNEVLLLKRYDPSVNHNLYVQVYDSETLADEPIGFATIPLYQVKDAPGKSFKGKFDLYDDDAKPKGTISLTISIIDSHQAGSHITNDNPEVKGESSLDKEHQDAFKSAKTKERAGDAAALAAAVGGVAALKSALGGSKAPKEA